MKHHFGGAVAVAVVVVLLLSSCGGQQPGSGGSDSESWGTAPQQPPRTTTAQSSTTSLPSGPQLSETLTPEQLEAANTVTEYIRTSDEVSSSSDADPQPLMDITTRQSQTIGEELLTENRRKGQVQTGTMVAHITGASEPVEFDGVRSVDVQTCTDVGKVDVINPATGKSMMPVDRSQYLQWNANAVKTEAGWKFSGATNENALRRPAWNA